MSSDFWRLVAALFGVIAFALLVGLGASAYVGWSVR